MAYPNLHAIILRYILIDTNLGAISSENCSKENVLSLYAFFDDKYKCGNIINLHYFNTWRNEWLLLPSLQLSWELHESSIYHAIYKVLFPSRYSSRIYKLHVNQEIALQI